MPMSARQHHDKPRGLLRFWTEQRWLHYLLLASTMTLLAFVCYQQHWLWVDGLDNLILDQNYHFRKPYDPREVAETLPQTRDIVMITLPHPVPRRLLAHLLRNFRQAKAVALDIMLSDQHAELRDDEKALYADEIRSDNRETAALIAAIRYSGNVILSAWTDEALRGDPAHPETFRPEQIWQRPPDALWASARYHAHVTITPDLSDHVVRRVPLFQDIPAEAIGGHAGTTRLPCFALALAAAANNISPAQLDQLLRRLPRGSGCLQLGNRRIPYDENGMLPIEYVGDRRCFDDIANSMVYYRVEQLYDPSVFSGKLVIIGGTDFKSGDFHPTPYDIMAGMQIHAHALATLLDPHGSPAFLPLWLLLGLAVGCSVLLIAPLLRWPLWSSLFVALCTIFLVIVLAVCLFMRWHVIMAASVPILAVILTYNAIVLYEYARVRFTLAKFIGPGMVRHALHLFTHLRLGGGRVEEASAMFCDLRGFSTLAELLPPETIAEMLNEFTSTVDTVTRRHQGRTIDYMGDGVFVLFEESLAGQRFSLKAVQASLELLQAFAHCRAAWCAQGLPSLDIGIAIHTGRMMIGMFGSDAFLKMGAAGDVVNVAARVQGLSRECGYDVLVTQETYHLIRQEIPANYCGTFPVKGREQPIMVYGIAAARRETEVLSPVSAS